MARKLTSGSVVTQVRFTPAEAIGILLDAARAQGVEFQEPDFGDGEGDSVSIDVRLTTSNSIIEQITDNKEIVVVLSDQENDSPA